MAPGEAFLRSPGLRFEPRSSESRPLEPSECLQIPSRSLALPRIVFFIIKKPLTVSKALHAGALDGRDVDEHISAAAFGLDEAVSLGGVEKLLETMLDKASGAIRK